MKINKNKTNIDKKMPGGGADQPTLDLNKFIEMASETGAEEFELDLQTGLLKEFEEWKKNNSGRFRDFLNTRRTKLSNGGEVEQYADIIDSYVRKIDVLEGETLTQYINRVTAIEKKED
jgi:hypothetical protein